MISYINYIKRLNELDVKLYDFQKRISYIRLQHLKSEYNIQYGGYNLINTQKSIIYKLGKVELENIILKLLAKEYDGANTLCKYYCPKNNFFI
jgi:hypothetical protein